MKEVESILEPITGYLISITRNTENGWYELEIGIPKNWVFNQNDEIGIELLSEADIGKLLKIFPKNGSVVIDDLILFVEIVINTNKKIAEKEEEFKSQMEEMRKGLELKAEEFFKELGELKENSFKKLNDKFVTELGEKKKRKRRTKEEMAADGFIPNYSGDTHSNLP